MNDKFNILKLKDGPINLVDSTQVRAWAPEYFFSKEEDVFYVYWTSLSDDHYAIHYVNTKNWKDIIPENSSVYYDLGVHDIDLTVVKAKGTYYGFQKPGEVKDRFGNRMMVSPTLDPNDSKFIFG